MFWLTDKDGNLVNLARADCIFSRPLQVKSWEVVAFWSGDAMVLYAGTREECEKYRDDLFRRLKEAEEKNQPDFY